MEINIGWWNTSLSPPVAKKTKDTGKKKTGLYLKIIEHLITHEHIDLLGLCEVDLIDIDKIKTHLTNSNLNDYKVIPLYKKHEGRIDDYCLIINSTKITFKDSLELEYCRDELETYYKIGIRVNLEINNDSFFLFLSHWQSQLSMKAKHRRKLGGFLRKALNTIFQENTSPHIILMGDFNDEPFDDSVCFELLSSRDKAVVKEFPKVLYNPFWRILGAHSPHDHENVHTWSHVGGTCLYKERKEMTYWKTFDQILFSSAFIDSQGWHLIESKTKICSEPALDEKYKKWRKNVSDHFPVISQIRRA
ncbi:endonuclease/exonuclease/phosphatase family protein [Pseudomonas sp. RHF3.3-3]|uniref:endonuclease/exonuclease/phosphatase family protein n=1 Tax=Pseudomonas sp. RHF3.3-3 TaxID=3396624 RepID=UPI003A856E28